MSDRTEFRIVASDDDFRALLTPWRELRVEVGRTSVLQAPAVLWRWWQAFGDDLGLRIVCAWRGAELVGVVPLQLNARRISGWRYRLLEFLGMPNELCRPEPLLHVGDERALQALADGILSLRGEWRLLQLDEIDRHGWWVDRLRQHLSAHGLRDELRYQHDCPTLSNDNGLDGFLATRSRRFGKRMRSLENRLKERGELGFVSVHGESDRIDDAIDAFFAVERRSWKAKQELDAGQDSRYRAFVRLLGELERHGVRRHAFVLTLDDAPIAATFGISDDDCYYGLQIAHDAALDDCSPGTLLEWHELRWFFADSGLQRYEFLGGAQGNKSRWTDRVVPTYRLTSGRLGLHWRARTWYKFWLLPRLRSRS